MTIEQDLTRLIDQRLNRVRIRWAAIGAALAVSLGASGLALVGAVAEPRPNGYVPVTPCRLIDTRFDIGPITVALGPNSTTTAVLTGATVGQCINVLPAATSLNVNITAVNPTENTFITVFPAGSTMPVASSLNPRANSVTGNEVNITLPVDDRVSFFNRVGTVEIVVDLLGYYLPSSPGPLDTLPPGQTITGFESLEEVVGSTDVTVNAFFPLPIVPTDPLVGATINFAPDDSSTTTDDDATCTGTYEAPAAPPGKVCIYVVTIGFFASIRGDIFIDVAGRTGFVVTGRITQNDVQAYLDFAWAYTAP